MTGDAPLAHVGAARQLIERAHLYDLPPARILEPALAEAIAAGRAPQYLPAILLIDALETAAELSGRETFALEMSEGVDLQGFGPLSALTGQCYSVEDALRQSDRYMHLVNGALTTRIERYGDAVRVERFCILAGTRGHRQTMDAALLLLVRAMRGVLGQDWSPRQVEFAHDGNARRAIYRRAFRAPLAFGAGHYAVELSAADFSRHVGIRSPSVRTACEHDLAVSDRAHPADLILRVRQKIRQQLADGHVSIAMVAAALGDSVRGLQRRLRERHVDYSDILRQQRIAIAQSYLKDEEHPHLSELANQLAFQDASAASRFLRRHVGAGVRARAAPPSQTAPSSDR